MGLRYYNLARMTTSTTGTGTITLDAAATGFVSFAVAGAVDGDKIAYVIEDPVAGHEVGWGVYTAAAQSITRNVTISSSGTLPISLSGAAVVSSAIGLTDMSIPLTATPVRPKAGMLQPYIMYNAYPQINGDSNPTGYYLTSSRALQWSTAYDGTKDYPQITSSGLITGAYPTGIFTITLPSAVTVYEYGIMANSRNQNANAVTGSPSAWMFQGSNDNSNWTTLDTQTGITDWDWWIVNRYKIASPGSYRYYRLNVTAGGGSDYMGFARLLMLTPTAVAGAKPELMILDSAGNSWCLTIRAKPLSGIGI